MICAAPAIDAPCTVACPTPPQPKTATELPGSTRAVHSAAPTPVVTAQPISASCSSGRSVSTLTRLASLTVMTSAMLPRPVMAGSCSTVSDHAWQQGERRLRLAQVSAAVQALVAVPAERRPGRDDTVASPERRHGGADLGHLTRALVPEDDRRHQRAAAPEVRDVGVAHPAGPGLDPHVVRVERDRLDVADDERLVDRFQDDRAHG